MVQSGNSHYETWKQSATYSKQFTTTQSQNAELEEAATKFFACTDRDMAEYRAEQERNRPADPQALIK